MTRAVVRIGPEDHGRRMTLAEFDQAEVREGHVYELGRGVIVVSGVPNPRHFRQFNSIRMQLAAYQLAHPARLYAVAGGGECKVLVTGLESERHPDIAVYRQPPPEDEQEVWSAWVPELVIEIVSPGSEQRDYEEKREEYLRFGVMEYWVVDEARGEVLALRRLGGAWRERVVRPPQRVESHVLRGFALDVEAVFAAAREAS